MASMTFRDNCTACMRGFIEVNHTYSVVSEGRVETGLGADEAEGLSRLDVLEDSFSDGIDS